MKKLLRFYCMVFAVLLTGFAQAQTVSGKVTDSDGQSLPGTSIVVKGTSNGALTDLDGNYTVSDVGADAVLVFSFVGFETQEIAVGGQSTIDVTMAEGGKELSEVVVTGYTSQSVKTITGSVDALDSKQAFTIPTTSAAEGFQGRLTGVSVIANNQPGEAAIVRIRGIATTGNNDPLYIIDGYQTNDPNFLTEINTSDIESVTVLKDAAVASVYGARASNGVIVIKTRKGSYDLSGEPKVTFDASFGVQRATNLPNMLNSQQLGEVFQQSQKNDGISFGDDGYGHPQFGTGATPSLSSYYRGDSNLPYDASSNRVTKTSDGTNWFEEIFEDAVYQNYYLSVNGGSKKSKYMMSMGYLDREGILTGTEYNRITGRVNSEFSIKDRIRIGENLGISYSNKVIFPGQNGDGSPIALAYRSSPLIPAYDEGGNFAGTYQTSAGLGNAENPLATMLRAVNNNLDDMRLYGDTYAEIDIVDGLTVRSNIGFNYRTGVGNVFTPLNPEHAEAVSINNLQTNRYIQSGWIWTNTVNYQKSFGDHNVNLLVGLESVLDHTELTGVTQQDFLLNDVPDNHYLGYGIGAISINQSFSNTTTLYSQFGQLSYNYANKYLLTTTIRHDKTSRFQDGNNSGIFPAVSAGWLLSEEDFVPSLFSNLKIRGSWGLVGNQSIPNATPTVNVNAADPNLAFYNFGGAYTAGAALRNPGTSSLTWETSQQINVGLDIGLIKEDLSLTVDYFNLKSIDNIIAVPTVTTDQVATGGFPFINNGEISNKGFEFSLDYGNKSKKSEFKYNVGMKFSRYINEIIKTDTKGTSIVGGSLRSITFTNSEIGGPISSFYGREVLGIFKTEAEVADHADQGFATDADGLGRLKYKDIDNNNVIDDKDRTALGSPNPDFTYGLNLDFTYKAFDMSMFFSGSQGNEIYNFTKVLTDFPTFYNGNRSARVLDAWSADNPNGTVPALSQSIQNAETQPNSYFVEDGSYFRMKNLQIGYTLPSNIAAKVGMSRSRVFVQASNLFTITNYSGLDPEIGQLNNSNIDTGIDFGSYPTSQTYLIGLSVDF